MFTLLYEALSYALFFPAVHCFPGPAVSGPKMRNEYGGGKNQGKINF